MIKKSGKNEKESLWSGKLLKIRNKEKGDWRKKERKREGINNRKGKTKKDEKERREEKERG